MHATIKNNHDRTLGVGGAFIPSGGTALVENWDKVSRGNAVSIWLSREIIEVVSGEGKKAATIPPLPTPPAPPVAGLPGLPTPTAPPVTLTEDEEKDGLIAKLAELGINKTKRTSLENLRRELATHEKS